MGVYGGFLLALAVLGLKVFWSVRLGVPLNETPEVWDLYYPEIRRSAVLAADLRPDDGSFDVLMLGGSVLEPAWGSIERRLGEALRRQPGGANSRIFNLAASGHTSRDSLIKYGRLEGRHFDLVLVYHGINDVRMNNCPRELFRDDYSHCAWYRSFARRMASGTIKLPIQDQFGGIAELIGNGAPEQDMAELGREVKTPQAFRKNLRGILDLAAARNQQVVLMSFAWDIPSNYSREAFTAKTVDYSYRDDGRSCGVEMWGEPESVRRTLDAHNAVIRGLASTGRGVLFVDLQAAIPPSEKFFVDPCHLTEAGCQRFVEALEPLLDRVLRERNETP